MKQKLQIVLSAALALTSFSLSPANAVYTPNKPTSVIVSSNSANNAKPESATVTVKWNASVVDSTHDYPRSYEVRFVSGAVTRRFSVQRTEAASYEQSFTGGLLGGTSYSVTVAALQVDNTEAVSDSYSITPVTSPGLPGSLTTDTARQSITLNWAAPSNSGGSAITGYLIRNIDSGETLTVTNPALTSQTIGNQVPGSTVSYQIAAINRNGIGPYADYDDATIPAPPTAPAKPDLTKSQTSVTASWVAVTAASPVTGYKVYLRDMAKSAPETATLTTSTTITFESLTAGNSYTVRVLATNLAGDSELSETSTVQKLPDASVLTENKPVFSPDPLPDLVIGGTTTVNVTVPSGGTPTIALTATPAGACTWNNTSKVVTAAAAGTCTLTATIAQTGQYAQGVQSKTFTVTKTLQTITFNAISNQPLPGPLTVSAVSTSGLTVTFTTADNCTVVGNTVSFTTTGSCTVIADQAGDSTYQAANSVRRTFTITAAASNSSGGGGSGGGNSGGGGVGGGGGGGVGTTWFNLFMADPENLTVAYSGTACAFFILKSKEGDKSFGPICATKAGALDYEANDGDYIIRTFDKDYPSAFKEYVAKVTFGTFEVVGAGFRGGSVPRRVITTLKKSEFGNIAPPPTPTATPSPTATPGVTPIATPKPSTSASPSPSPSAKPTGYVIGGKVVGAVKPSTLTAATTKVTIKLSANFQAVIPTAKKGDKITMIIKDPKGKSFTAPVVKVAKAGSVKLPSIKFSVAGKYTITIKVGTKTKIVTLTATK